MVGRPVARDFGDDVGDVGVRVDAVGLAGLDDGVEGSGPFATWARAGEQPVAPSHGYTAQRTFRDIVVDLEGTIIEKARQRRPALGAIGDGPSHVGFG